MKRDSDGPRDRCENLSGDDPARFRSKISYLTISTSADLQAPQRLGPTALTLIVSPMHRAAFPLLLAGTTACLAPACGGQAEQSNTDAIDDAKAPGGTDGEEDVTTGNHSGDGDAGDGDAGNDGGGVGDGDGDDIVVGEPAPRTGGFGGQPLTVDLDLWCPIGDEWESLLGQEAENLGGAPGVEECPELPRLEYGVSYCLTIFASTTPVVRPETGSCCYAIESIYCR